MELKNRELDKLDKKAVQQSNERTDILSSHERAQRKIHIILDSLKRPVKQYDPLDTVNAVLRYLEETPRLLYSEITHCVYALSEEEREGFGANVDRLVKYATNNKNSISPSALDCITKLWDHFNLACYQINNSEKIILSATEVTQKTLYDKLYDRFKIIEREYITILGIFASIVLAFVGGLTFSTSVLENMAAVSIWRLILVILLIGFVLINTVNVLLQYIFKLNDKGDLKVPILSINIVLLVLTIVVTACWAFSVGDLPAFLDQCIPW